MPNLLRRGSPRADSPPEITGLFPAIDHFNEETLPNREQFSRMIPLIDAGAALAWARSCSPEEFWKSLFSGGTIHHPLYTEARSYPEASSLQVIPRYEGQERVRLAPVLIALSHNPSGRELALNFLRSISTLDCYRISKVTVPAIIPAQGLFPLTAPHTLSFETIRNFSATASLELQQRWLRYILGLSVFEGHPYPQNAPALSNKGSPSHLRLLSLNVWGVPGLSWSKSARFPRIAKLLQQEHYDGVALQEMWDPASQIIPQQSGMPYQATCSRFPGLAARSGLVNLARYPLSDAQELTFSSKGGVECAVAKGAMATRITKEDGSTVLFANTHLASPPERGSSLLCSASRADAIRAEQILELGQWLRRIRNPGEDMLVLGDFNCPEDSLHYQLLKDQFGFDLFRERLPLHFSENGSLLSEGRSGFTFDPKTNPWARRTPSARLDYCFGSFSRPDFIDVAAKRTCCRPGEIVSDHYGIEISIVSYREGE
jgi:endonuclease/exonuclease/phosphatase family metal-dependent hydrolase